MDIVCADAVDPRGKFRVARGQHQRMQPMWHQIAQRTRAVGEVFSPPMKLFSTEGRARLHVWSEPTLPIDILRQSFILNQIVPFPSHAVAAIIALAPDQLAQFATLDQICTFVPAGSRTALRADLVNLPGLFHRVVNLECLVQVASHRLLAIHVFARFHGIHRDLCVPRIMCCNHHRIDILALE